MSKSLSKLFAMLKSVEVGPKGKKPQRDSKRVAGPPRVPKVKPGVKCFYCKGDGHWKRNYLEYFEDKKVGKVVAK
jgi:hypothetical protein